MKNTGSNALWKISGGLIGLATVLVVIVAANVIISNVRIRKDLTGEKLYTLSQGTKNILNKLDSDVTLKLYFSSSAPEVPMFLKNYGKKVEDLLQEYRMLGGGRVTLEKYDPTPDSDAEEWAQRYGIQGQQAGMMGPPIYFGVVASCGSTEAVIPNLDPRTEELLEYNITRLIYRIAHPEKPTLGVISSLPVTGPQNQQFMFGQQPRGQAWVTFQQLKDDYNLVTVAPTAEEIDSQITALVIVHPKDLPDKMLYAIDQFILRGGRVLAFVDPFCAAEMETAPPQQQYGRPNPSSNLEKLFTAWGVTFNQGKVLADMGSASRIRSQNNQVEDSPVWLTLREPNFSKKDIVTTQLKTMMVPFAGTFTVESTSNLTVTPLITSSDAAGLVDTMMAQMGSSSINRSFKKEGKNQNIAVRLVGKFKTAFPNGKPKDEDPAGAKKDAKAGDKDAAQSTLKEGTSAVVLVGDVDMIYDRFCVEQGEFFGMKTMQPINDNISFFANTIEQISGSSDLIGIRSRGRFQRPFDRVLALEQKARLEWQSKEESLMAKLQAAQQSIQQMQDTKDKSQRAILSTEQKRAITQFRDEEMKIKNELKTVRKNLRSDIETLGMWVKVSNIALMPLIVALAGITYGIYRRKQR